MATRLNQAIRTSVMPAKAGIQGECGVEMTLGLDSGRSLS
jgi:hypothetical protein